MKVPSRLRTATPTVSAPIPPREQLPADPHPPLPQDRPSRSAGRGLHPAGDGRRSVDPGMRRLAIVSDAELESCSTTLRTQMTSGKPSPRFSPPA